MSFFRESVRPALEKLGQPLAWHIFSLLWAVFVFWHLYEFSYPSMDSWCYFAPAAAARYPFDLSSPLLGSFAGLDHTWGLHWPAGPLLLSCATWMLPRSSAVYVLLFLSQWWLVACLARKIILRLNPGSSALANLAAFCLLADRTLFRIAWCQRYEILTLIVELSLLLLLASPSARKVFSWNRLEILLAFFLLPILQPMSLGAGACFVAARGAVLFWRKEKLGLWCAEACAFGFGIISFWAYFHFQPDAQAAFTDHAGVNLEITKATGGFYPGRNLFEFPNLYAPLYTGALLLAGMFWGGFVLLRLAFAGLKNRAASGETHFLILGAALFGFAQLLLAQATYNIYYMAMIVPWAVILAAWASARVQGPKASALALGFFLLLFVFQSGFWAGRTVEWFRLGCPRYRTMLSRAFAAIPPAKTIFVPEILWEEALRSPRHVMLNNLPNNAGDERRQDFNRYLQSCLEPGSILVFDSLQAQPSPLLKSRPWKLRESFSSTFQGTTAKRGFEIFIFESPPDGAP